MRKTIKTITTLKKHVGDTVHVVSYDGYEFDAKIVDDLRGGNQGLFTTDQEAKKDTYWWSSGEGFAHITVRPYQITEELKSITLVKGKVTKTTKTFVSADELKANVGHYCEMADGSTGLIAGSEYPDNVCVLHNSEVSEGWIVSKSTRKEEIKGIAKSHIKKFSKGWHVSGDMEAKQVKVAKILDEVVKCKKAKQKAVTLKDLKDNIGHECTFKSGDKGYICEGDNGHVLICFNSRQNGHGWVVDGDVPEHLHNHFKLAYFVFSPDNIEELGIASINPETTDFQAAESKKTLLDMTIREALEKLDEIISSR